MKTISIEDVGDLGLRPFEQGDTAFVMATWIRSFAVQVNGRDRPRISKRYRLDADVFFGHFPTVIVCSVDRPDTIHGWACGGGDFLAWAYVPIDLRGYGIGRAVITEALGGYPGTIWVANRWQKPVNPRFIYDEARYGEALERARTK